MSFILSKVLWMFAAPGNLLVLLLIVGAFMSVAHRVTWQIAGRRLCFAVAFILFLIAVFPVGDWALTPLENRFPPVKPDKVDGIILLGGDENPMLTEARDTPSVRSSASRYISFAVLARKYPNARLVYTGGSALLTRTSDISEGEVAKRVTTALGIPVSRITFEDKSRNTHENAMMSAAIVQPKPEENWLLITGAYHMPRSIGCFRQAGWNVYPMPSDYISTGKFISSIHFNLAEHLIGLTTAVHEYTGLLAYWAMGYIASPWPK